MPSNSASEDVTYSSRGASSSMSARSAPMTLQMICRSSARIWEISSWVLVPITPPYQSSRAPSRLELRQARARSRELRGEARPRAGRRRAGLRQISNAPQIVDVQAKERLVHGRTHDTRSFQFRQRLATIVVRQLEVAIIHRFQGGLEREQSVAVECHVLEEAPAQLGERQLLEL